MDKSSERHLGVERLIGIELFLARFTELLEDQIGRPPADQHE